MAASIPRIIAAFAIALTGGGCNGGAPTSPTSGPTAVAVVEKYFSGTLDVGGARFYSFTVTTAGSITATLASVTSPRTGAALSTPLALGLGVPRGTGCSVGEQIVTAAALRAQFQALVGTGIYCLNIADGGTMSAPASFAIRFTHP